MIDVLLKKQSGSVNTESLATLENNMHQNRPQDFNRNSKSASNHQPWP